MVQISLKAEQGSLSTALGQQIPEQYSTLNPRNTKVHPINHFPIFLAVAGRRIALSGGGNAAMAKLRLLMKTEAYLTVIAA